MQVSVEETEGLERKMTVAVPSERIETDVDSRLRKPQKLSGLMALDRAKFHLM